jgi:hypothetical protein
MKQLEFVFHALTIETAWEPLRLEGRLKLKLHAAKAGGVFLLSVATRVECYRRRAL